MTEHRAMYRIRKHTKMNMMVRGGLLVKPGVKNKDQGMPKQKSKVFSLYPALTHS